MKLDPLAKQSYSEVLLKQLMVVVQQVFPDESSLRSSLTIQTEYDFRIQGMLVALKGYVWSRELGHEKYRFPRTWWDHVKERFAPKWFLKWWPVEYRTINVDAWHTYPTLNIQNHSPRLHLQCWEG